MHSLIWEFLDAALNIDGALGVAIVAKWLKHSTVTGLSPTKLPQGQT